MKTVTIIILTLVAVAVGLFGAKQLRLVKAKPAVTISKQVHIDISLKNGKPEKGPFIYAVNKGDNLEFSVDSDKLGTIGVPTTPPQKVVFNQSPVVFRLTASATGSFQLTYQATGQNDVILIGTIQVRETGAS